MGDINTGYAHRYLSKLLTLPGEEIIVAKRKHWFVIVSPIVVTTLINAMFIFLSAYSFLFLLGSLQLFVLSVFTFSSIALIITVKSFIDWYFHIYVITNHKILEVSYAPLFSHVICDVLLEQVRCTEVDVRMNGIFNELMNKGDISLTFDRPTHEEEFILTDVKNPRKIGATLVGAFEMIMERTTTPTPTIWYQTKKEPDEFKFIEQIFPKQNIGIN